MYKEAIADYFKQHTDELVRDVARLVAVESVSGAPPAEGAPYGAGPRAALDTAADILRDCGFAPEILDGRVLVCDLAPGETRLAMLAHADVVPAGDGWTVTEPFTCVKKDGVLYGRGVCDDKGPAVAAMYAMRAVRDLALPLAASVRLVLGSCEEVGMDDVRWYFSHYPTPPMVFSPDSDFPLVNTEKGRAAITVRTGFPVGSGPRLLSLRGGTVVNAVPAEATALVAGVDADILRGMCHVCAGETGAAFTCAEEADGVRIVCRGTAAHAAHADKGLNAVSALMRCLAPLALGGGMAALRRVLDALPFGDVWGETLGVACADDVSGRLTVNLGIAEVTETALKLELDCRLPVCADGAAVAKALAEALPDMRVEPGVTEPAHHVPADSRIVKTLLSVYEDYTGLPAEPLATGGLTYVHEIEGGVAFGCEFPHHEYHIHEPDERMPVADLVIAGEMFAEAIARLCG